MCIKSDPGHRGDASKQSHSHNAQETGDSERARITGGRSIALGLGSGGTGRRGTRGGSSRTVKMPLTG